MAADETPEDRLEAALERIAKIVDASAIATIGAGSSIASPAEARQDQAATEFADRLDRIIDTLREALGK
jgi:hypothetical protein